MDDDSLRNWGYYEPPIKSNLSFHLMSNVTERDTKPFHANREDPIMVSTNGAYHHQGDRSLTEQPITHMDYVRDSWINHRERFLHMFPGNHYNNNPLIGETSNPHHPMQMMPQPVQNEETGPATEESVSKKEKGPTKKLAASSSSTNPKAPKGKRPRKAPTPKEKGNNNNSSSSSTHHAKTAKRNVEVVINGVDYDISSIPIPVCSCTGNPQQCYRWGCGGWQSACCTTTISIYPLPMSTKRRGARIAGRKMSQGAFKKVLEKLASEGYNFANPIDLRTYWAKHGTNKFVVIR